MKYLRKFESFDKVMVNNSDYPSLDDMKAHICVCGYDEMEVDEMSYDEVCSTYDVCKMESNESRRYRRRYESFDMQMMNDVNENPSEEDMMNYLVSCGYNEMDVMNMDARELAHEYEVCQMEMNEARKTKKMNYKKSGLKNPHLADLNKDGEISGYEKARGKAIQKSVQSRIESKKVKRK